MPGRLLNADCRSTDSGEATGPADRISNMGDHLAISRDHEALSTSMGVPLQVRKDSVMRAVERVVTACEATGVAVGAHCVSMDDAGVLPDTGVRCLSFLRGQRILLSAYYRPLTISGDYCLPPGDRQHRRREVLQRALALAVTGVRS